MPGPWPLESGQKLPEPVSYRPRSGIRSDSNRDDGSEYIVCLLTQASRAGLSL